LLFSFKKRKNTRNFLLFSLRKKRKFEVLLLLFFQEKEESEKHAVYSRTTADQPRNRPSPVRTRLKPRSTPSAGCVLLVGNILDIGALTERVHEAGKLLRHPYRPD
jgi:hypothetical protein